MKRLTLILAVVFCFVVVVHANINDSIESVVNSTPNTERIQALGKPLVSFYIVDFFMSGNYSITYQEPDKELIHIYCNGTTFESLCRDYDMMQELALNVKWGITSYNDFCIMEAKFEKKYTYAKNSKNVYWLTMSN